MKSIIALSLLVLLIVGTINAEQHRFCGDNGDCKHQDKEHPSECCLEGKLNGYHECLPNPDTSKKCPEFKQHHPPASTPIP